jgi:hypothetical protein
LKALNVSEFGPCYSRRALRPTEEIERSLLGLEELKTSRKAVGRHKDLNDLERLTDTLQPCRP